MQNFIARHKIEHRNKLSSHIMSTDTAQTVNNDVTTILMWCSFGCGSYITNDHRRYFNNDAKCLNNCDGNHYYEPVGHIHFGRDSKRALLTDDIKTTKNESESKNEDTIENTKENEIQSAVSKVESLTLSLLDCYGYYNEDYKPTNLQISGDAIYSSKIMGGSKAIDWFTYKSSKLFKKLLYIDIQNPAYNTGVKKLMITVSSDNKKWYKTHKKLYLDIKGGNGFQQIKIEALDKCPSQYFRYIKVTLVENHGSVDSNKSKFEFRHLFFTGVVVE